MQNASKRSIGRTADERESGADGDVDSVGAVKVVVKEHTPQPVQKVEVLVPCDHAEKRKPRQGHASRPHAHIENRQTNEKGKKNQRSAASLP
jgi:hypothetical protein